jgi:hypothetical protein
MPTVELRDHVPPELGESGILRLQAAVTQQVSRVVRELNRSHPQSPEHLDEPGIRLQDRSVLAADDEADAVLVLDALHVGDVHDEVEPGLAAYEFVVLLDASDRGSCTLDDPRDGHLQRRHAGDLQSLVPALAEERGAVDHQRIAMQLFGLSSGSHVWVTSEGGAGH